MTCKAWAIGSPTLRAIEYKGLSPWDIKTSVTKEPQTHSVNSETQSVSSDADPSTPLRELQNTQPEHSSTSLWGDRPVVEAPDFSYIPVFDDEDKDENTGGTRLYKVSQKMETFLKVSFSAAVPNPLRRQCKQKNRCTKHNMSVNKIVEGRLSAVAKSCDKQLSKQQVHMLGAGGLITYILEEGAKTRSPSSRRWRQHRLYWNSLAMLQCKPIEKEEEKQSRWICTTAPKRWRERKRATKEWLHTYTHNIWKAWGRHCT